MLTEFAAYLPHLFSIIGVGFSAIFITLIMIILIKALRATDVRDLFTSQDEQGGISLTKFWQNVAYAAATIAFLSVNITGKSTGASLEMVWVIYLGVVASNAVLSKWIAMKYTRGEDRAERGDRYGAGRDAPYPTRPPRSTAPTRGKVDDPDA